MARRVTLVLGAGGPVGHAYHAGVVRALHEGLGWDARDAALVVGTSAGAQVAALLRAGMDGADLSARVTGDAMSEEGRAIAQHFVRPDYRDPGPAPSRYTPSSKEYLGRGLRRPWELRPGRLVSALLPAGRVCLKPQIEGLRTLFGHTWPDRPLWITAVDRHSGERVAFGRAGTPHIDVGTAVASSGAVPSICAPIEAHGRSLVDGGIHSATHLDLLEGEGDDVVVVSSPLSMIAPMRLLLAREVRRLRNTGREVVTLEPRGELLSAMGRDPMALERAPEVARRAHESWLRELERPDVRRELEGALR